MKTKHRARCWVAYAVLALLVFAVCVSEMAISEGYAKYKKEVCPEESMSITFLAEPMTFASGRNWYQANTDKSLIKEVKIVTDLPADIAYDEQWDASETQGGWVTAAVAGTTVYISPNGAGRIEAGSDLSEMFSGWSSLEKVSGLSMLDTGNTTAMTGMFQGCSNLTELDISGWDTGLIETADNMFHECKKLQKIIVGNGTTLQVLSSLPIPDSAIFPDADGQWYAESSGMGHEPGSIPERKADTYYAAQNLLPSSVQTNSADLNGQNTETDADDTPSIPDAATAQMLAGASWYQSAVSKENITEIFFVTELPEQDIVEQWDISELQDESICAAISDTALYICTNGAAEILANEDASYMFSGFTALEQITGIERLDTSACTTMRGMFYRCQALKTIPGLTSENWNTSLVWDMTDMFFGCKSLETIDLSGTEIGSLTVAPQMFYGCKSLTAIIGIENWDLSGLVSAESMFGGCDNLVH